MEANKENVANSKDCQQVQDPSTDSSDKDTGSEEKGKSETSTDLDENKEKEGKGYKDNASVIDHTACRAAAFLQERVQELEKQSGAGQGDGNPNRPQRSPYLARLEFLKLLKERGDNAEDNYGLGENST